MFIRFQWTRLQHFFSSGSKKAKNLVLRAGSCVSDFLPALWHSVILRHLISRTKVLFTCGHKAKTRPASPSLLPYSTLMAIKSNQNPDKATSWGSTCLLISPAISAIPGRLIPAARPRYRNFSLKTIQLINSPRVILHSRSPKKVLIKTFERSANKKIRYQDRRNSRPENLIRYRRLWSSPYLSDLYI